MDGRSKNLKRKRGGSRGEIPGSPPASSSSASSSYTEEEVRPSPEEDEEEVANWLILLASGRTQEAAASASSQQFECRTCSRSFPTFQALGGHRTSHKKPKVLQQQKPVEAPPESDAIRLFPSPLPPSPACKAARRAHECSICGSVFPSGQALGGHMRRHRSAAQEENSKCKRILLSFDLNLPAAPDDDGDGDDYLILVASLA